MRLSVKSLCTALSFEIDLRTTALAQDHPPFGIDQEDKVRLPQ